MLYWKHNKSTFIRLKERLTYTTEEEIEIKKTGSKDYKVDELRNDEEKEFSWLEVTEVYPHLTSLSSRPKPHYSA